MEFEVRDWWNVNQQHKHPNDIFVIYRNESRPVLSLVDAIHFERQRLLVYSALFGVVMNQNARWALMKAVLSSTWLAMTAPAIAEERWNACEILRQADVQAAFATHKFDAGTLGKSVVKSSPKLAAVSRCTYASSGATPKDQITVSLLARRAPSDTTGVTPEAAKEGARQLKSVPVDVSGLGDGAYTVNMGSSTHPVIELNVFRGKRDWLIFSCGAAKLDHDVAIAGLKKIAQTTMARQ